MGEQTIIPLRCRPSVMKWNFNNEEAKNTVYVSNLSPNITKIILRDNFTVFGKISDIRLQFKQNYAYAYIQFQSEKSAANSLILNQTEIEKKRKIGVAISDPSRRTKHQVDSKLLYVSNIANSIMESDLKEKFSTFGDIREVRLVTKKSNSFAYIHYLTEVFFY